MVMSATDDNIKDHLISKLSRLKILREENELDKFLNEILSFVEEKNIRGEIIGEILGAFILECCDYMMMNTSLTDDDLRKALYDLSLNAYKLYIYSSTVKMFLEMEVFIEYFIKINKEIVIEATSKDEINKEILDKVTRHLKKRISSKGLELSKNIIIDKEEDLEKILPLVKKALRKNIIRVAIIPTVVRGPLFFREYCITDTTNHDVIKSTIILLEKIVKSLKSRLCYDDIARSYVNAIEDDVKEIIKIEMPSRYISNTYKGYKIKVWYDRSIFQFEVRDSKGKKVFECKNMLQFKKKLSEEFNISLRHASYIVDKICDRARKEPGKLYIYTFDDLLSDCEKSMNQYNQLKNSIIESLTELFYEAITEVLVKNCIKKLNIFGKNVIVKPTFKNISSNDSIVINVHVKSNGDMIEIAIKRKVHQIYSENLKNFVRNVLIQEILKS